MRFLVTLIFFTGACLQPSWASEDLSDKPIIDEELRSLEIEIKEKGKDCRKKGKNTLQIIDCKKKIRQQYEKEGRLRGTDEYCKKHYGKLSFDELHNVWGNLKTQRKQARIISPGDLKEPGEITEVMFRIEESWVEDQLAQRQKEKTKILEKEVYKKTE